MDNLEIVGRGATAAIYRDGGTAIKLYVNAPPREAENEALRQNFAYDAGLPVPAVFGVRKIDEHTEALEMAYIDGQPLIRPKMDKDARRNALNTLVTLQCSVHQVNAEELPKLTDALAWKIERTPHLDRENKNKLLVQLNRLDDGSKSLCHGDFHAYNILFDGSKHWIIDWVNAAAGNPLADACRTYLLFTQYMFRSAGIYLKTFCAQSGARPEDILDWLPVTAAARLAENPDDKAKAQLLKLLDL